ncbi:MAG TPA: bifunctional methylenetetrahydrofolate dehydrogenase/methenyltetrahydrofolate cyclohydrolase FolD [Steroidobacteraceae bacterium]|jgi:methylenetetrahydrofolate dehydrogenase (NADP+) / methenyltetrahydrofolate cyclohydrolase|nr:bifunctional methylenetetrahydrofolate dehydrogenase/methenyltetrahydrofolate cyclohydrolase FolD [Steroidobacteraceae bacterium]
MSAKIIDGKAVAEEIKTEIRAATDALAAAGRRRPGLAVVMVGNAAASEVYVRNKRRACEQAGIISSAHDLSAGTSEAELLALIGLLNTDSAIDGILVQLPLPPQVRPRSVIDAINPAKDVDGFHPYNLGRLAQREPLLRCCTPYGVMRLLESIGAKLAGIQAVVVGASSIVGRPMALELLLAGATVTVCHSRTRDLAAEVARADLVVAAVGQPNKVRGEWIKPGAIVIDVGINRLGDGRLAGDVEFAPAAARAGWITPVPGGVGPMTVAMLMQNTLEAYQKR